MKWTLFLFLLIQGALANTTDSKIVSIDGLQTQVNVNLQTEKSRLEWRYVQMPATCYRTEYRRRCTQVPPRCRRVCQGRQCRRICTPPRRMCRNVAVRVPYRCMREVRRQVRVLDYYVDHNVTLNFNTPDQNLAETLKITAIGDILQIEQIDRNDYSIIASLIDRREILNSGVKHIDYSYSLDIQ